MKLFDMLTRADIQRIKKTTKDPAKRIEELETKCREAGRAMIELNLKYETALADLAREKEERQYDNMVHQKELNDRK